MTADDVVRRVSLALKRLRLAKKLTLPALAKRAGLSPGRAEDIEEGRYGGMTLVGLVTCAGALGVPLEFLADSIAEPFEQTAEILEEKAR